MKKKILFFLCGILLVKVMSAQNQMHYTACNVDGYWSKWYYFAHSIYGNYGQICDYTSCGHPSNYRWRFTINNYITPSKDDVEYHYKNKIWWEYSGFFEYYVTDEFPDIRSIFTKSSNFSSVGWLWVNPTHHDPSKGQTPCVKRTSRATIKIAPYKDHPKVYNIWFEGVGFAFDLHNSHF